VTPANIFKTVCQLLDAHNFDKILKVESKYSHLDTFSTDPVEYTYVVYAFGCANNASQACCERAKETPMVSTKLEYQ